MDLVWQGSDFHSVLVKVIRLASMIDSRLPIRGISRPIGRLRDLHEALYSRVNIEAAYEIKGTP